MRQRACVHAQVGERRRDAVLKDIALSVEEWTILARKEKAVYHTLNQLSVRRRVGALGCSRREGWDSGHGHLTAVTPRVGCNEDKWSGTQLCQLGG